jgi:hypothetical protein
MEFEFKRVESFAGWTKSYIDIRTLSASGFYYKGANDIVRCTFCGTELSNFDGKDVIIDVHTKFAPRCLQRYDPRNIPLARSNEEISMVRLKFNEIHKYLSSLNHTDADKELLKEFSILIHDVIPCSPRIFGNYKIGSTEWRDGSRDVVG